MKASRFILWGKSAEDVMEEGYIYQFTRWIIGASDIVIFGFLFNILRSANVTFGTYAQATIIVFFIAYFITTLIINRPAFLAYRFLAPVRDKDVRCDIVCATPDELYEVMYGELRVRLKKGDTIEHYIKVLNSTCCLSQMYPYRMYDRLMKLNSIRKEGSVPIYVYSVRKKDTKPSGIMFVSVRDEMLTLGEAFYNKSKELSALAVNRIKDIEDTPVEEKELVSITE